MRQTNLIGSLFLVCAMLLASAAQAQSWPDLMRPAASTGGGAKDAAVVVGVGDYFVVSDIPGADDNALAWTRYLNKTRGVPLGHITLLQNYQATRESLEAALKKAAQDVKPGGTLWFVFIGHGAASKDGRDGMLIGADAQNSASSLYARSLSREEALRLLSGGKQAHTVVVLDTCFSGQGSDGQAVVAGLQPLIPAKQGDLSKDKLTLFTAGTSNQFAGPLPGADRPAFSYLMLGALRGWGDADQNSEVTAQEARDYTWSTLQFLLRGSRAQTPQLVSRKPGRAMVKGKALEAGPDVLLLGTQKSQAPTQEPGDSKQPGAEPGQAARGGPMVRIPAGEFVMGANDQREDQRPRRSVYLDAFEIDKYEVTVADYRVCMEAGGCKVPKLYQKHASYNYGAPGRDNHPINGVNWFQAQAYCKWVGKRLPTEAEWEKAARGTDGRSYPWGEAKANCAYTVMRLGAHGEEHLFGCGRGSTWPVGSKSKDKSPYGVHDMGGNVGEWTADWYGEGYYGSAPERNPKGPTSGSVRVLRGGGWDLDDFLRASSRGYYFPSYNWSRFGIRCAR